jgi:hypothetical protein
MDMLRYLIILTNCQLPLIMTNRFLRSDFVQFRIHQMNLKETYTGLLVLDALEHILKARQVRVIREKGL